MTLTQFFTFSRHRRLRSTLFLRDLVRENSLSCNDLIYPLFVQEGVQSRTEVPSMPGVYQFTLDLLEEKIQELKNLGIKAILLFGIPSWKDELATSAYQSDGIVQRAIKHMKALHSDLIIITDTCICHYQTEGHCGIPINGGIDNDVSLDIHAKVAISQAEAGADILAPSSMMDGIVAYIRHALDESGYKDIPIMSYGIKYASSYYGPFRDAADNSPAFGDRRTYQMDPANCLEAFREAQSDIEEGADFLIIKPGLPYLDIIRDMRNSHHIPLVSYQVSSEYAQIKAAAQNGWINEKNTVLESMISMKRAGADLIVTYFAIDIARYLLEDNR
ncbi:porphobilinogen synthase [Bacillus nakamurai]|uniref:Delta-aminolevulinic acid dehydratase n=1 Tax=Bacillus nakamurai TaxID=1793963 RepID=A0A150F5I9_9BACI|nr:porphobilinogen synthase [Bacillus nakamurai]KXZ17229.1 delta-aminolevulinic acid dehydratase [Bacillus nakamurai]MED1228814.1 porphobilinogen synthase [Bacillus nakamurai]